MTQTLEGSETIRDAEGSAFEGGVHILALGILARMYANTPGPCPMRGWGASESNVALRVGDKNYSLSNGRRDGKITIIMTVRTDGDPTPQTWEMFRDDLENVLAYIPARRIG